MDETLVIIPVTCGICGITTMLEYPTPVVLAALTIWCDHMKMYARCHTGSWDASEIDMQNIKTFLGTSWIKDHTVPLH